MRTALEEQGAALEVEVREKDAMMSYSPNPEHKQLGRGREHWLPFGHIVSKSHEDLSGGVTLVVSIKKPSSASATMRGWGLVGAGEVWEKLVTIT